MPSVDLGKANMLAERLHSCGCGTVLDREVAAAMVVHFRAFGFWPETSHSVLVE
jgi:putative transposase